MTLQDLMRVEEVLWIEFALDFPHQRPGGFRSPEEGEFALPAFVTLNNRQIALAFPGQSPQARQQRPGRVDGCHCIGQVSHDNAAGRVGLKGATGPFGLTHEFDGPRRQQIGLERQGIVGGNLKLRQGEPQLCGLGAGDRHQLM